MCLAARIRSGHAELLSEAVSKGVASMHQHDLKLQVGKAHPVGAAEGSNIRVKGKMTLAARAPATLPSKETGQPLAEALPEPKGSQSRGVFVEASYKLQHLCASFAPSANLMQSASRKLLENARLKTAVLTVATVLGIVALVALHAQWQRTRLSTPRESCVRGLTSHVGPVHTLAERTVSYSVPDIALLAGRPDAGDERTAVTTRTQTD